MRRLSPLRNSTKASDADALAREQLRHFGIDPADPFGAALCRAATHLYACQGDVDQLWRLTFDSIDRIGGADRIARFNAKKFLSFQLAKILDSLQNPFRRSYQGFDYSRSTRVSKGSYSIFDNVTALFSATPVIARTATYIYACAEWIEDAFKGRELLLEIYSRLLNPTSLSLANHIVDLEAGPYADQYLAWNFSSGMAAIDAALSHVLGYGDILIMNRTVYGGSYQLIHDWYARPANLAIRVETFDGATAEQFVACWHRARHEYADLLDPATQPFRRTYVFLESPCNPHGYVLDVPAICRAAHAEGLRVILDATVATPFLSRPLQREAVEERPDFVIHSYTKDLAGTGSTIAGVVIGRNEDMFIPKGESAGGVSWDQTMFWNVYYVKGAFLSADASFEVLAGMRTLELRMLEKCVNTLILARFLDRHPNIHVRCNGLDADENAALRQRLMHLGLPAPLFTIHMDGVPREAFHRFFDCLEPTFGHMISLGQPNTIVSCPALTTHSELDDKALRNAGIEPTTIRFAVGNEDPIDLVRHFIDAARLAIEPAVPGFAEGFMPDDETREMIRHCYVETHRRYIEARTRQSLDSV
ncbi:MAG: Cys/Met metabolism pyridoxal-phosphate-dependent enzyme [Phycisphaeraceae bacterium]|nr:Cys/Met metabolism pyridoxal-phosphate-dependent enzyme [Phycisphaeraceae bacterium]